MLTGWSGVAELFMAGTGVGTAITVAAAAA
jgi:hypothetical protein